MGLVMVPLDRALPSSCRLSMVTILLSVTIRLQFDWGFRSPSVAPNLPLPWGTRAPV